MNNRYQTKMIYLQSTYKKNILLFIVMHNMNLFSTQVSPLYLSHHNQNTEKSESFYQQFINSEKVTTIKQQLQDLFPNNNNDHQNNNDDHLQYNNKDIPFGELRTSFFNSLRDNIDKNKNIKRTDILNIVASIYTIFGNALIYYYAQDKRSATNFVWEINSSIDRLPLYANEKKHTKILAVHTFMEHIITQENKKKYYLFWYSDTQYAYIIKNDPKDESHFDPQDFLPSANTTGGELITLENTLENTQEYRKIITKKTTRYKTIELITVFKCDENGSLIMNKIYITDDNYEEILKQSNPIVELSEKIKNLDIHTEDKKYPDTIDYNKSIQLANEFNRLMGQFFTAIKNLIGQCENKKDSWVFFNSTVIMHELIKKLQFYYYQRNEEITLNFITMFNKAFDSIEDQEERKNTKILACYAIYNLQSIPRLLACRQLRMYWDAKTEQVFLHIIRKNLFPIDIFKHFSGKEITDIDINFTDKSIDLQLRNAFKSTSLYTISFQKTTNPHIFLPICDDFHGKSLKEIHENKEQFSSTPQPASQPNTTSVTKDTLTAQSTNKKDIPADQTDQSNPAQVGFGTRFLQRLKTYAVPIFFGTAALSAVYFFRAYLM